MNYCAHESLPPEVIISEMVFGPHLINVCSTTLLTIMSRSQRWLLLI